MIAELFFLSDRSDHIHFSVFVFHSTFWFSLRHFAFWLRIRFLFFTFPFPFLTFWFSLLHFTFRLRFRFLLFYFSISVSNFFNFYRSISFHFIVFVLAFKLYNENQNQNLIINIRKNENQETKNKNQNHNRQSRPTCFAGRSIWGIKVSFQWSAALLTMLAPVNFLILPPWIALNHKLYFFSKYLLILLFKLWKSR